MSIVWSTEQVSERERFDYWRAAISHAFVPLEPERDDPVGFNGRIEPIGPVSLRASTVAAARHHVRLSRQGLSRQRANPFFVNLLHRGRAEVCQHGEIRLATPGDVYVVDSSAPWSVDFTADFEIFCVELDESMLRHRLGTRGRLTAPVLSGAQGAGCVLSRYMSLIRSLPSGELAGMETLMTEHCASLLARINAGAQATTPALRDRQATLHAVLAFIERNLTDPKLSPEAACNALNVSRSYLFKVLAEHGETFEGRVRNARLAACRETLLRRPAMPVSRIALSWGFADVASFNRAYRRRYGETPSQTRQ